ncbi:MAG: hypothetical protein IJI56_02510 [Firmicutes bacterium]|nr:hypothetical protein [Bacillota bacterium]
MQDMKKIKAEYVRGGISYKKLAEKYDVPLSTLSHIALKEKWADLKQQTSIKADMKMTESISNIIAIRENKIQTAADMLLDMIIVGMQDGTITLSSKTSIRDITGALRDIREIKGIKSDLDLQEQMARIEKLKREAKENSTDTHDIKVIISGDLEEYVK